jgi:predicted DNA-binding transcriptional regulator AlpA
VPRPWFCKDKSFRHLAEHKILDNTKPICDIYCEMKRYTTPEAAKELGLSLYSLHRYTKAGKIPTPVTLKPRTLKVLPWTDEDIERVRKILPKIANGRKTRYQKERAKKKSQSKGPKKASKKK